MTNEEIRECKYIDDNMKFYTYEDFVKDAKVIRKLYATLKEPIFYKWFVYSNIHCTPVQKDMIWEYLNGNMSICLNNFIRKKKN